MTADRTRWSRVPEPRVSGPWHRGRTGPSRLPGSMRSASTLGREPRYWLATFDEALWDHDFALIAGLDARRRSWKTLVGISLLTGRRTRTIFICLYVCMFVCLCACCGEYQVSDGTPYVLRGRG